jgi:hypothetical protein
MAAEQLKDREWEYDFALAICRTRKALADDTAFFVREERKLIEEYAARDESGNIKMADNDSFIFAEPEKAGSTRSGGCRSARSRPCRAMNR